MVEFDGGHPRAGFLRIQLSSGVSRSEMLFWRLEKFGFDLSVRTVAFDPGWLAAHLDECDD
ncbi:hypothetical protein, partial [Streptomyces sp. NPDC048845]|uniref:hypothetical protein n=1 Tax=Streptomyces sp. NPDC048845 TaxID=3155390 RepID=UPI0034260459